MSPGDATESGPRLARWRLACVEGQKRGWPVLLPLAFLPIMRSLPTIDVAPAAAAIGLFALFEWGLTIAQRPPLLNGTALLDASDDGERNRWWACCLLVPVVAISALYVVFAAHARDIVYNDGAYYYGVARHMALTGRFEEPIVWHFLNPPPAIVHAPFDYWGGMTSLLLVPSLMLFGATPETGFRTMGVVSAAGLVAFWYLVCIALPLRHRIAQLIAVALFAFSPAMVIYRFQPESVAVSQLFLLLALIAFSRQRLVLAVLCAFALLLTRSDGLILFALIFLTVLLHRDPPGAASASRRRRCALVGLACLTVYVIWSATAFGTATQPAAQILPFLRHYMQVHDFGVTYERSWSQVLERFTYDHLAERFRVAWKTLHATPFTPFGWWWLALALLSGPAALRAPTAPASLIWLLCFGGYLLVVWMSGPGFAEVRAPHVFMPLVVLAGALGIDAICSRLRALLTGRAHGRIIAALIGAAVLTACAVMLNALPGLTLPEQSTYPLQHELPRLDAVLQGEPVAANLPWYMVAYTRSPVVMIPKNGEAAVEAALAHYQVRWLVIFGRPPMWAGRQSVALIERALANEHTDLGRYRLERVPLDEKLPAVFRVHPKATPEVPDADGRHG